MPVRHEQVVPRACAQTGNGRCFVDGVVDAELEASVADEKSRYKVVLVRQKRAALLQLVVSQAEVQVHAPIVVRPREQLRTDGIGRFKEEGGASRRDVGSGNRREHAVGITDLPGRREIFVNGNLIEVGSFQHLASVHADVIEC